MKSVKALFQLPLFLLILYLGSVNLYEVIRAAAADAKSGFAWDFSTSLAEGILEIALLVWLYRWLGRGTFPRNPIRLTLFLLAIQASNLLA